MLLRFRSLPPSVCAVFVSYFNKQTYDDTLFTLRKHPVSVCTFFELGRAERAAKSVMKRIGQARFVAHIRFNFGLVGMPRPKYIRKRCTLAISLSAIWMVVTILCVSQIKIEVRTPKKIEPNNVSRIEQRVSDAADVIVEVCGFRYIMRLSINRTMP